MESGVEPVLKIRKMEPGDWPAVLAIYGEGLAGGRATFERRCPEWSEWDARHDGTCRLVALEEDAILGWIALSPVSSRSAYRGVAELSVYVARPARGRGIGAALTQAIIALSERQGFWTLQAGIFPENEASLALLLGCGFRVVGRRERIGWLAGRWRDTLLLERRSEVVSG